jgi:vacuolar-type H+-ATPase subunit E/Vma4
MTLERLIAEIQSRAERDLAELQTRTEAEKAQVVADRDRRAQTLRESITHQAEGEARRESTQRIAGARMQARKVEYEARERAMESSLQGVRGLLSEFTASDEYESVLERMCTFAQEELGKELRISGRPEDASTLKSIAGKSFDPTPRAILGGLIAETVDGERRLTLTFDELLRLREDRVRALLA